MPKIANCRHLKSSSAQLPAATSLLADRWFAAHVPRPGRKRWPRFLKKDSHTQRDQTEWPTHETYCMYYDCVWPCVGYVGYWGFIEIAVWFQLILKSF